jgi:cell division protein FtsB
MPSVRRLLGWVIITAIVWFAVQGGEYSTWDLLQQRWRKERLTVQIDSLHHQIDSLAAYKKALLTDPVLQERIAREEFGMIRGNKEILYRFAADSAETVRKP